MNRNISIDLARTLAIVLMVVFHFIYDLKFFGFVDLDIPDGEGWKQFRWLIITLFFLCLGISLHLAHGDGFRLKKFAFRFSQIAFFAAVISVASYIAIPENWIFFGVLHFLAVASLLVVPFINKPFLCAIFGVALFFIALIDVVPSRWPFHILFDNLPKYTNDYVGIVPWLGMVFFGVCLAHTKWLKSDPLAALFNPHQLNQNRKSKALTIMSWPGQHSLSIYVLHQPIMMSGLYLLKVITNQ